MSKKAMMCSACEEPVPTRTEVRARHHYVESGLDTVWLESVTFHVCPNGHSWIEIPAVECLHRAIALAIVGRETSPTGPEVKYLRKYLGLSNEDFAKAMGVSVGQSSRWASGDATMAASAENLLRTLVRQGLRPEGYSVEEMTAHLQQLTHERPTKAPRIDLRKSGSGWTAAAA